MALTVASVSPLVSFGTQKADFSTGIDISLVTNTAKQRASIKWLLAKAFNNKVPDNIKEPFYRDHDNQEHLKPQIVGAMANAEIYCGALANIYSDPNYHNLNHWAILQTLARKNAYVQEPADGSQLTETTLIQTNPLRMTAHMAVVESIMSLYSREVISSDRVMAAAQRFTSHQEGHKVIKTPANPEQGALLWVQHACDALRERIELEQSGKIALNGGGGDGSNNEQIKKVVPSFPAYRDLKDLCDGVGVAALVSYYCPTELSWQDIRMGAVPSVQDSIHNLRLVKDFCLRCLPCSIFHLQPEDITYLRDSMRPNLLVFLADLFNVMEIHPMNCVRDKFSSEEFPVRNAHGVVHKRNLLQPAMAPIPDLRSCLDDASATFQVSKPSPIIGHLPLKKASSLQQSQQTLASEFSEDSLRRGSEESFVVHRGRNIPTLRSVLAEDPLVPARLKINKERQNADSKADERGEVAAGKPSNWEEHKKVITYAGRRSRRNSTTDESQLTIENFGGSQDNLNFIGRNPDKELTAHVGRKVSTPTSSVPVRSSLQDARGSFQLAYEFNGKGSEDEKRDNGNEKTRLKRQISSDDITLKQFHNKDLIKDLVDGDVANRMSFADLGKNSKLTADNRGIHLVYMNDREEYATPQKPCTANGSTDNKRTSFITPVVNQTTWQQQVSNNAQDNVNEEDDDGTGGPSNIMASQLNDIRLQLEEKRRHIESEKRRMEMAMSKQRQKVGKAAFLQAVSKEITDDATLVEKRWLDGSNAPFIETRRTPDLENMDLEQYQRSLAQMNSSLSDIQTDIQRLAAQQNQMQVQQQEQLIAEQQRQLAKLHAMQQQQQQRNFHQNYYLTPLQSSTSAPHIPEPQSRFFLHETASPATAPPPRRTWQQQQQQQQQQQPEFRTWSQIGTTEQTPPMEGGFTLHHHHHQENGSALNHSNSFTLSQRHQEQVGGGYGAGAFTSHSTPSASPQHRVHEKISQLLSYDSKRQVSPVSLQAMDAGRERKSSVTHAPVAAPSVDDMEPQNISFIGNSGEDAALSESLSKLNITSGSRTYRIPSPTRPRGVARASPFGRGQATPSPPTAVPETVHPSTQVSTLDGDPSAEKGFYISFDDEQPKRPKPALRSKRNSPKKERSYVETSDEASERHEAQSRLEKKRQLERELEEERVKKEKEQLQKDRLRAERHALSEERQRVVAASALVIGEQNDNPDLVDERERKKEKILMMSLQRRQQQEEAKARKEAESQRRKEIEKEKEEEKLRRKEEQAARRATILEQYKLKKAIEEAEREGKTLDKQDLMSSLKPTPKMRSKGGPSRPRPKTIHIDSGSVQLAEGMVSSKGRMKGSTSNLTGGASGSSSMKRDYYRGSQDSLADRSISNNPLYKDSPDDSHGMSPCQSAHQTLGRRSSYKTSRGSSTDQDSLAYRFGDTDSGLGRATPPRRAPSPGMGGLRHLPSPSGPGSLPGFMSKGRQRVFDDGSSDISSTPSSMMDYTGPRLYKQPATKSNRSIMLNAVEYCVFPGVVNRDAKKRVLEEINRSESKHFLILFRDAGCQFRALYSYCPDTELVSKLYGTGPKQVNDKMFDKFFKYNSGGKCFSQVHTKHLTVTIDAFTIHNSLWQGKKVNLPSKKDMALVV
ncbi:hypothetical protein ABEB36_011818 [Hypothenemus hampei]|uniref:Patronin n=1 Tax=Hypothenemus hampei TaxID=57062 RepID=A0ABD1EBS8_HYPHA